MEKRILGITFGAAIMFAGSLIFTTQEVSAQTPGELYNHYYGCDNDYPDDSGWTCGNSNSGYSCTSGQTGGCRGDRKQISIQ